MYLFVYILKKLGIFLRFYVRKMDLKTSDSSGNEELCFFRHPTDFVDSFDKRSSRVNQHLFHLFNDIDDSEVIHVVDVDVVAICVTDSNTVRYFFIIIFDTPIGEINSNYVRLGQYYYYR